MFVSLSLSSLFNNLGHNAMVSAYGSDTLTIVLPH